MSTSSSERKAPLIEIAKAIGPILGVPLALFAVISNIVEQPIIALIVALVTAALASVVVVRSGWTGITEVVVAWLALIVVALAGFVIWPRTMTVEGIIVDTAGTPVRNEEVVFFDRSGRRYETRTNAEGYYQFIDVPTGRYKVRVRGSEIEGETKGLLVRVVQQNLALPETLAAASPTPAATDTPLPPPTDTPTATPTSTPTPVAVTPTDTPTPTLPVYVSNVKEGDTVAQSLSLVGEYAPGVTDDIWVFVGPLGGRRWPQSPNACAGEGTRKLNGRWEVHIGLGGPGDAGALFEIIVTTANTQASQSLTQTLQSWCQKNDYPGFTELPAGLIEYDQVRVVRGSERYAPHPPISNTDLAGELTIASGLKDGDTAPQFLTLSGTVSPGVTDSIWVLVYSPNGRFYPQSTGPCQNIHTVRVGDRWQVPVHLGGPGNGGEQFDIITVLADAQANAFFEEKQQEWCQANNYPGLLSIELPQGIDEKESIRVMRE